MFNSEVMAPKVSIEYRIESGFLTAGTFDDIPENAWGAYISAIFPVVGADGEFKLSGISYNLYVGEVYDIDLLKNKENFAKFTKDGVKKIVSIRNRIFLPFNEGDAVFANYEQMAEAITKINQNFKSINFSVQNLEVSKMHN